jgi:hypothetical protein
LDKHFKTKEDLNLSKLLTNSSKYSLVNNRIKIYDFSFIYKKKIIKNSLQYQTCDNNINLKNLTFTQNKIINSLKNSINLINNDNKESNLNFNLSKFKKVILFKNKLINNVDYNLFNFKNLKFKGNYDYDKLEELHESAENLRKKTNKFPVRLIKGVMVKSNIFLLKNNTKLNKNIFLNYKVNNTNLTPKISQVEQF